MSSTGNIPTSEGPEDILQRRPPVVLAQNTLEMKPIHGAQKGLGGHLPNTPLVASIISFLLGSLFSLSLYTFVTGGLGSWWSTYQLGFYLAAWSGFHWGEYAVTAGWNREKCSIDSFLLDNGQMYHAAHSIALLEYLVTLWMKPEAKAFPYVSIFGMILVLAGQVLRSGAMMHAGTNFSHQVAFRKRETHILVTDGIYAWLRHPSYTGFFYWALGTQLVLQNPLSFIAFAAVMWKFFNSRIQYEERALISFFGRDYALYRQRVGTKIPFIA